ncbi:MAG: PTS sugar transporter subunit IIA [Thermoguttaceae bacterium]|nr:PTS sugar transporter subunit IIA [Thermoguttaceae bacterium]
MKFSDFILVDSIITGLKATTKEGVVREMVQSLQDAGGIPEAEYEGIVNAIMRREELGSTGIGRNILFRYSFHS